MDNWGSVTLGTLRGTVSMCLRVITTEAKDFGYLSTESYSLLIEIAPANTNSLNFCVVPVLAK